MKPLEALQYFSFNDENVVPDYIDVKDEISLTDYNPMFEIPKYYDLLIGIEGEERELFYRGQLLGIFKKDSSYKKDGTFPHIPVASLLCRISTPAKNDEKTLTVYGRIYKPSLRTRIANCYGDYYDKIHKLKYYRGDVERT